MANTTSPMRSVEPKYSKGQQVRVARPTGADNPTEARHLTAFVGESMTIIDVVGARFVSPEGPLGMSLYYVRSAARKKALVPEEWLVPT